MNERSDTGDNWDRLREKIIGLGEHSVQKSYYPELQRRLAELERFRALLDQSNDAILTAQVPSGRLTDVNESACHQLGYSRRELLALSLPELVLPEVSERIAMFFVETEGQAQYEGRITTRLCKRDGATLPVEMTMQRVTFHGASYVVAVARDITERVRLEEELRASENRYRTLFEHASDAIFVETDDDVIVDVNRRACDLLGYSRKELLTMTVSDLQAPEVRGQPSEVVRAELERYGDTPFETVDLHRDGTRIPVEVTTTRIPYEEESLVLSIVRDIRERKVAEGELRRLKEFNESLVQSMAEGIAVEDPEGYFTFINPAAAKMLGCTPEELVGEHWTRVVPPDQQAIIRAADERRMRGETDRYEVELQRKDGARIPVLISGSPYFDAESGRFAGTLAVFTDISERVRAESEIRQHTAELEALREVGLELAAQLDLDTLLQSIVSRAVELLGGSIGGLYLYEPEDDILRLAVGVGMAPSTMGKGLAPGEGLAGKVWQTGEPAFVEDYRNWAGRATRYDAQNFRAIAAVPIRWGEQSLGVLNVIADVPGAFSASEAELLRLFAAQAATALENARLFQAEREQRQQAEAQREAARVMGTSLDLYEILRLILDQLKRVLTYDTASVLILRKGTVPDLVVGVGYADEQMTSREAGKLLQESPILQQMARDLQPVVSADVRELEGWIWVPGAEHLRSWMGIPLVTHGEMIGALMLDHTEVGFFGQADVQIAQALAQHAAQAIENARLHDETLLRNRELALLNRVIATSAASREIEKILAAVCRELAVAFDLPQAVAALLDEQKAEAVVVAEYQAHERVSLLDQPVLLGGNPFFEHLLEYQQPLMVADVRADPRLAVLHPLAESQGVVSLLFVPLVVEGQVVGGLVLGDTAPRSLTGDELNLVQRVAEEVGGALARARLEETQRRLSVAVEQSAEAAVITDAEGVILYTNPAFLEIVGCRRAEVIGRKPEALAAGPMGQGVPHVMGQAIRSDGVWHGRFKHRGPDDQVRTLDMTVTPVRDQAGESINHVATIRDVTREVLLEMQFRQAQKMQALGRLAGGVSHDFNNLLTVILFGAQMLERKLHVQDPLWEYVLPIKEAANYASRLTAQLLSFSRREVIEPRILDLNRTVGELGRMLQRLLGEHVQLVTSLAGDLWPIKADRSQIDQVLVNLAANARDAMPEGGTLLVETENVILDEAYAASHVEAKPGEYVLLAISDTGVGMSEAVQARLFEPFFTTKERGRGTGLGLATVFGIVKQGGGHIRVYSEEGQGTTFRIYLPRAHEAEVAREKAAPATEPRPQDLIAPGPGTETVLLVEDEARVRDMAAHVLELYSYRVLTAGDGLEALQVAERHRGPIHLLLTDVVLPHMNGKELAEQLKLMRPGLRVLYTSGYTDNAIAEHGVLAPGVNFLSKPFTINALTRKVREVLDRSA